MEEDNFLTTAELREVADLCEFLNDKQEHLGYGTMELYDSNGELCGYVSCGDGGYAYYPRKPKTDE